MSKRSILALLSAGALGVLALGGGIVYFVGSPEFEELAAGYVMELIERETGTVASIESFDVDFLAQTIGLNGLELRGDEEATEDPLVLVDRIEIGFRLRALFRRRIDLWSLRVLRPQISLKIGEGGRTNVPSRTEGPGQRPDIPFEIAIGDFVLSEGSLAINETRVDIDFELSDVQGLFDYEETTRVLSGDLDFSGRLVGVGATIPYRLETDFAYAGGRVSLQPAVVTSGETRLVVEGGIDDFLGSRAGVMEYSGVVDLPFLNHFFPDTPFSGTADVAGDLDFSTSTFHAVGHAVSARLVVDDWVATDFETDFGYGFPGRIIEATNLATRFAGGEARGTVAISPLPGSPVYSVDLNYRNMDPTLFGDFFPWGVDYVGNARASGHLAGRVQPDFDDFDLEGNLTLNSAAPGLEEPRRRVTGSTAFHATPGLVVVDGLVARLGQTRVEADGRIDPSDIQLSVVAESSDLRDLAFLHPEARGRGRFAGQISGSVDAPVFSGDYELDLGSTQGTATGEISREALSLDVEVVSGDLNDVAFLYPGAEGRGRFRGHASGGFDQPDLDGEFALDGVRYDDWAFDHIAGGISLTREHAELTDVLVTLGSAELTVGGLYALDGGMSALDVRISGLGAENLEALTSHPMGGTISGDVRLSSIAPLDLNGFLKVADFAYDGNPIGDAQGTVAYGPELLEVTDLVIDQDEGRVRGTLRYEPPSDELMVDVAFTGQQLAELVWLGVPDSLAGRVRTAEVGITGTAQEPIVQGRVVLADFAFGRQSFPEASIDVRTAGTLVSAVIRTDERLDLEVDVDTSVDGYRLQGQAAFRDFDVGHLAGLEDATVVGSGNATFEGLLEELASLTGQGDVTSLTATLSGHMLDVTRPFNFAFDTSRLTVSPLTLVGEGGTSVELDGTIALEAGAPINLNLYGEIDLAAIGASYENLATSGRLLLDAYIEGTVIDPEVGGAVTLTNVAVGHDDLFLGLSELNGDIFLDGPRASLIGIRGVMGGGRVTLSGTVGVGGAGQGSMDIRADATNVRVRTLTGLRTVFDGAFGLGGTVDAPILDGSVQLQSLSFQESFDEFLALFDRRPGTPAGNGPLDNVALAVHVEGDRNIRVQNELANLESRVDLDIGGTLGSPSLVGHAEISRGTLNLQSRRYRVTRGNVDFVDPVGIDPRIDIQAEADIRDYRIILLITGQGDDVQLTMRSEPALPQIEIVSLIAGGRTREELSGSGTNLNGVASEEQLFQGAASTILADMLQSRVGSRLGVLNSVRIDPFLVGAENNPVARLTVSEQITSDLEITYSQDLSSNSQQIIQIEYFLNGDTSFIASRDESGRLGLDIKLRKRFD